MSTQAQADPQSSSVPFKIIIAAGTYDGGIAGYELNLQQPHEEDDNDSQPNEKGGNRLQIVFASPVHGGSVRSLTVASSTGSSSLLLSTGYDEMLKTHDFGKRLTSSGEVRTPADFGTPVCAAFAPPFGGSSSSTHCLVGFGNSSVPTEGASVTGGKLVIYKKRDWSVVHVLPGHEGGVATVAVHPTGKLALSGGLQDGKLKLWDLERGRLAFSSPTIKAVATHIQGRKHYDSIDSIVWSHATGDCYAFCHGSHITVRDVETGKDMLDVDLPSKVNQICLLQGPEGLFVAAACNDGSLPVLAVENVDDDKAARRAIMAIEPVDGPVAGEERFKCIQTVTGYYVATANSAGVVSLMNLEGAVRMITSPTAGNDESDDEEAPVHAESDASDDDDDDVEEELAVEIIDSVQLGTGARITCLAAWTCPLDTADKQEQPVTQTNNTEKRDVSVDSKSNKKFKRDNGVTKEVFMDPASLEKARALVSKAKKIQKRKSEKKHKLTQRI
jgi:WD40 repeat protein